MLTMGTHRAESPSDRDAARIHAIGIQRHPLSAYFALYNRLFSILFFLFVVICCASSPASAAVWYVNDASTSGDSFTFAAGFDSQSGLSTDSPKRTIQAALNLATAGDIIYIDAGTYSETVVIDTNGISLVGKDSSATVIDPPGAPGTAGLYGIFADTQSSLTIRDLAVTGAYNGIRFENVDSSAILRDSVSSNGNHGIFINAASDSNVITGVTARQNTLAGIYIVGSSRGNFSDNLVVSNSGNGIHLDQNSCTSMITGNTVVSNAYGIYLSNSCNNDTVASNTATGNTYGMYLFSSSNNTVCSNAVTANSNHGIYISTSANANMIYGNSFDSNSMNGIFLVSSANQNIFRNNSASNNNSYGVLINGSSNNHFVQNSIESNAQYQVYILSSSAGDTFRKNNLRTSTGMPDSGVWVTSGGSFDFMRNSWNRGGAGVTNDSLAIRTMITCTSTVTFVPFRLGLVDTHIIADTVAPKAPDTVAASALDSTRIFVTWARNLADEEPHLNYSDTAGYRIYRSTSPYPNQWSLVKDSMVWNVSTIDESFTDTGLSPFTTYFYKVTTYDARPHPNESWYSDSTSSATTQAGVDTSGANVWYVNDTLTVGDSYCYAIGSDSNDGLTRNTPKRNINVVMPLLTSGDTVYVDAGLYCPTETTIISCSSVALIGKDSVSTIIDFNDISSQNMKCIYARNQSNITLKNFTVTRGYYGFYWIDVRNSIVDGISSKYNQNGVRCDSANSDSIQNCEFLMSSLTAAVYFIFSSESNYIGMNRVSGPGGGGQGIVLSGRKYTIESNTITSSFSPGIAFYGESSSIRNNSLNGVFEGIVLQNADNNHVIGNSIQSPINSGISLTTGSDSNMVSNNSVDHAGNAISVAASFRNEILNNTAVFSNVGLSISADTNVISGNICSGNTFHGFNISGNSNSISHNAASNNGKTGYYLIGNSASNGNLLYQNTSDSNGEWEINIFYTAPGHTYCIVNKCNMLSSAYRLDSGVLNNRDTDFSFIRNWWGNTDSNLIRSKIWGTGSPRISYTPYRLGPVDTTLGADTVAPRAPDTVVATALSPNEVRVSWAQVTLDEENDTYPTNLTQYRIYRSRTADTSLWVQCGSAGAGILTFDDSGLAAASPYYYRVTSVDNWPTENQSWYSDSIAAVTTNSIISDSVPPSAFSLISPATGTETRNRTPLLSWQTATDSSNLTYRIIVETSPIVANDTVFDTTIAGTSITCTPLGGYDTYYWRVLAIDSFGNSRWSIETFVMVIDTAGPTSPTALTPLNGSETSFSPILFSWTASVDSVSGLSGYRLQIDTNSSFVSPGMFDSAVPALVTFGYRNFTSNDTYWWRVVAVDDVGNTTAMSAQWFRFIGAYVPDTTPPAAFSLLTPLNGTETRNRTPLLTWQTALDSSTVTYRVTVESSPFVTNDTIFDTTIAGTSITCTALPGHDTAYWRVRATDSFGNTRWSSETFVIVIDTVPPTTPTALTPSNGIETTATSIFFSWAASTDSRTGINGYRLQIDTTSSFNSAALIDSVCGLSLSGTRTMTVGDTYWWRVIAFDDAGNTSAMSARWFRKTMPVVDTTPPPIPTLISPSAGAETRIRTLDYSWTAVTDSPAGLAGYRLQIVKFSDSPSMLYDSTTTATNLARTLPGVDSYFWRVVSFDSFGNTDTSGAWRTLYIRANAIPVNRSRTGDTIFRPNSAWTMQASAYDTDADPIAYALDSAPSGMTRDSATGALSWTPSSAQVGIFTLRLRVSDSYDTVIDTVTLIVNDTPRISYQGWNDTTIWAARQFTTRVQLIDSYISSQNFAVANAPAGLTIDSSGNISWTPSTGSGGVYSFQIIGRDGIDTAVDTYRITVIDASETQSSITGAATIIPDGSTAITIAVMLRDQFRTPIAGYRVSLQSDRSGADTFQAVNDYTDTEGYARFLMKSNSAGTSVISAYIDSTGRRLVQTHTVYARTSSRWYVAPSGSDAANGMSRATPFKTIDHAMDVANYGDIIQLMTGTFTEAPINVTKNGLTFVGDGVDSVFVTPQNSNSVGFSLNGVSYVFISEMTIQSSSLGVKVLNSDGVMVRACKVLDNRSCGIWVQNSRNVSVLNNFIDNPSGERNATGIHFKRSDNNCVVSNTVKNHRLGGIVMVDEQMSNIASNEVYLDSVPGVGTPLFNKASLVTYGDSNTVVNNNMYNTSNNRSLLYVERQTMAVDNFEILGNAPPKVIDEPGYRAYSNDTGVAYCDVNGDGISDNGRIMNIVGYFGSLNPFGANPTNNQAPQVRRVTLNGETEGTSVVFDTSRYVIGWTYSDSDGHPQKNVEITVARDSLFQNVLYQVQNYQSADTIVAVMKPEGTFYVKVRANDGRLWSDSAVGRFVAADTPTAPRGVNAADGAFNILVGWSRNPENDLAGYRVYRSDTSGGPYTLVATVGPSDTMQYLDRNVTVGAIKYYVVTAFDSEVPSKASAYSLEDSGTAFNPISGITIDGKFTGWAEYGVNEWAQVGAQVTPGRLSKVYVYTDSKFFYIGVDFLMTVFIDQIKNDPTLWNWYQQNKGRIFNYFEFKDKVEISLSDPNVVIYQYSWCKYYYYRDPNTGTYQQLRYKKNGQDYYYIDNYTNPNSNQWFYEKVSFIRVYGDGRYEFSPSLKGQDALGATAEVTSPNDSSIHRVYEIRAPLSGISANVNNSLFRLNVGIFDWDFPGATNFLNRPVLGQSAGNAVGMSVGKARAFAAATAKLDSIDPKTQMSLASSLAVARAFSDEDVNSLLPEGYTWYDGPAGVNPEGTPATDLALWGSETTPIEAAFTYNTPPVAMVARETIYAAPGAQVPLDGTLSADSEMPELLYLWSQTSGSMLSISDSRAAMPTVTIPSTGADTQFVYELTVSDRIHNSAPKALTILMGTASRAPTATVATKYVYGVVGETVTLRGSGTDPDGDALTYSWSVSAGNAVTAQSLTDSVITLSATVPGKRTLVFSAYDSGYMRAQDTAVLFIADTIPTLTTAGSSALNASPMTSDTSAAIFQLAGANEVTARCLLQNGAETAEIGIVVDLASGYENSRLVIARTDSSTMRRGLDNLLYYDSFAKFMVELHLVTPAGASIGGQTAVFDKIELRIDPLKTTIGADLLTRIKFFTFDDASGKWIELTGVTTEDMGDRLRIKASLGHLSFYTIAVAVPAAANLSSVVVYPNPFRPNNADVTDGVEYVAGVANTGITFENLPTYSNIKIYTTLGELVAEHTSDANGGAQWDVRNKRGEKVASGAYVYVVTSPAGERRTGKLVIVR